MIHHMWNFLSKYVGTAAQGMAKMKEDFLSESPTDEGWCARFNKGAKLRMGEKCVQDKALTAKMVLALAHLLEER